MIIHTHVNSFWNSQLLFYFTVHNKWQPWTRSCIVNNFFSLYSALTILLLTVDIELFILVLELDITLPSLFTMDNGFTLTIALYDQRPQTRSLSVNLIFCSTCEKSFPFHPLCDVVSPASPVLMVRASTTMAMSERIRSKIIRIRSWMVHTANGQTEESEDTLFRGF